MLNVLFLKYCAKGKLLFIDYWYKSYYILWFYYLIDITSFSYLFSLSFVEFYWFEVYDRYWQKIDCISLTSVEGPIFFFQIIIIVPSSLTAERNGTTPRPEDKILRDEEGIRWEKGRMTGQESGFVRVFFAISRLLQPFHVTLMRLIISAIESCSEHVALWCQKEATDRLWLIWRVISWQEWCLWNWHLVIH